MISLSSLPDELIILIAEACDVSDKARLARSNRRLNDLATRVLLRYSVQAEGNSAMYWAAEHGHIDTLERMRSYGAEVNDNSGSRLSIVVRRLDTFPRKRIRISAGFLPLHIAAKFGQTTAVQWLLKNGARIDSLAQHVCQCEPGVDEVEHIEDFEDFDDVEDNRVLRLHSWTPLHIAICSGHISTAKLLISRGAAIRSPGVGPFLSTNVFHTAARRNNTAAIEFLVSSGLVGVDEPDSMGFVALHHACSSSNNLPAIKKLIHLGASLDILGQVDRATALRVACETGFFHGAVVLLAKGAVYDISSPTRAAILLRNAARSYLSFPQRHRSTDPTIWEDRREDFIRRLVALGVSVDEHVAAFPRFTPLARAAGDRRSLVRTLQVLLELGADVNATDDRNRNPIHLLLYEGGLDFYPMTANKVNLLLRYGARPDLKSDYGSCAFDMALRLSLAAGDVSIMAFFLQNVLAATCGQTYVHERITRSYESRMFDECRILVAHGAALKLSDKQLGQGILFGVCTKDLKQIDLLLDLFPDRTGPSEFLKIAIEHYKTPGEGEISIIKNLLARPEFDSPESACASRLLQFACRHHSPAFIAQLLLEKGAQVNGFDDWWETPLSCAVARGCRPMVRLLLLHGADPYLAPSEQDWSAYVCEAPHGSNAQHFNFLDNQYPTSFMRAIREYHRHGETHSACQPNADETLPRPLELMLEHRRLPPLPQEPQVLSYIHLALEWPRALRVLLASGADPNSGHHCVRPPLLHFLDMANRLRSAKPDALMILLEFGADIRRPDDQGRSFLTMMRSSALAMVNSAIDDIEFEGEGLEFAAVLLLRNFFITLDDKSGEDCVKPRPEAIAETNHDEHPYHDWFKLKVCNDGISQTTL